VPGWIVVVSLCASVTFWFEQPEACTNSLPKSFHDTPRRPREVFA
jgi:hypothetical protein